MSEDRTYIKPRIVTIEARQIVEFMGPVQGLGSTTGTLETIAESTPINLGSTDTARLD